MPHIRFIRRASFPHSWRVPSLPSQVETRDLSLELRPLGGSQVRKFASFPGFVFLNTTDATMRARIAFCSTIVDLQRATYGLFRGGLISAPSFIVPCSSCLCRSRFGEMHSSCRSPERLHYRYLAFCSRVYEEGGFEWRDMEWQAWRGAKQRLSRAHLA